MSELVELRNRIMEQMYNEAEPGLDFMDLLENPDDYPDDWYSQHTLSSERQREIFEEHVEGANISDRAHAELSIECITNLGPSSEHKPETVEEQ